MAVPHREVAGSKIVRRDGRTNALLLRQTRKIQSRFVMRPRGEVVKEGITVNVICPTRVHTPMVQPVGADDVPDELVQRMTRANPVPQPWIEPEDVSRGLLYLVTDPGVVTGSVLEIGLGSSARIH